MKIGAMANSFKLPFQETVRTAAKLGITGLQISIHSGEFNVDNMTDKKIAKLKEDLSSFGLEISAFCGDMGGHGYMVEKDNREWKIERSKKMVDLAEKVGVHVITTHIGVIPFQETDPIYQTMLNALTEIGGYAHKHNVTFAIETGPEKAEVLKNFLDKIPCGVGVNFDPANFRMVIGQDPAEGVRLLHNYIVHTHAKDGKNLYPITDGREVYGTPDPTFKKSVHRLIYREVALGKGQVPWEEYLKALREVGYNGYLTIERECGLFPVKDIAAATNFLLPFTPPLVYAVIGCGGIANGLHFPAIMHMKHVKIKYCCDIVLERAQKDADKYGIKGYTQAVADYHDILADPEVDAVIVCTHTFLHAQIAIEAMKAGKHVLSEKPMAATYELAKEMSKTSHETGKISNVGVVCRFHSVVEEVKKVIDSGKIGKVYHVFNSFRSFRRVPGIGGEFTNKEHSCGGVLYDLGVHNIDQILYIIGNPKPLTASGATYLEIAKDSDKYYSRTKGWNAAPLVNGQKPVCNVEEYATGFIRTETASINFSGAWAQNIDHDEWYIDFLGDKGGIRMYYCGRYELFTSNKNLFFKKKPLFKRHRPEDAEHIAFRTSIITGIKTREYIDELLGSANILDGLYLSASTGKEVDLNR